MSKITFTLLFVLLCNAYSFAQVGINTVTPDPSSALDIESTTGGLLLPRMTTSERNSIVSPAEGLFIYNLNSNCFQYYKGTAWSGCLGEVPANTLDCSSSSTNGAYATGSPLNGTSNTLTIDVLVNIIAPYTITTNTVNGYSFSASGSFTNIGLNTVTLAGSGTPTTAQTDTFTITLAGSGDTCTTTNTVTNILPNCLAYFNAGASTDGIYTVDTDGAGPNAPYDCYCDMTDDDVTGGGWTLVFNHNTAGGYWTGDAQASEFNVASPSLGTNKYSILSRLDDIKSAAPYEFKIFYPTKSLTNHWSQTFDPRSGPWTTPGPVAGYVPISITMTQNNWGGLERSGGNTYLDGTVNSGNWFYSIGSVNAWNGGIPSNNTAVNQVQLFIR